MLLVINRRRLISRCRRRARRAASHRGWDMPVQLDPFATGLLVLAVGNATRLLPYLDAEPKVYEARFRFGFETDSDDSTGVPTVRAALPDWAALDNAITSFTGAFLQTPPAYAAKHVNGERAYKKARRGKPGMEAVEMACMKGVIAHSPETLTRSLRKAAHTCVRWRETWECIGQAAHVKRAVRQMDVVILTGGVVDALERGAWPMDWLTNVATEACRKDTRHQRLHETDIATTQHPAVDRCAGGLLRAIRELRPANARQRARPRVVLPAGDAACGSVAPRPDTGYRKCDATVMTVGTFAAAPRHVDLLSRVVAHARERNLPSLMCVDPQPVEV